MGALLPPLGTLLFLRTDHGLAMFVEYPIYVTVTLVSEWWRFHESNKEKHSPIDALRSLLLLCHLGDHNDVYDNTNDSPEYGPR